MDTAAAFAMGETHRFDPVMVFDWHKAARLIAEREPDIVGAGLRGDWDWTGGDIWESGKPISPNDTYTYLSSTWATPEIDLDGEVIDCYVMRDDCAEGWTYNTYWPESALQILREAGTALAERCRRAGY